MALLLGTEDVRALATTDVALGAMRSAFEQEAAGLASLPPRLDASTPTGFFRTMPAVLDDVMGCKIMTLVRDQGTRYLVMLYDVASGGLLAVLDADELTKLRTAATTALAGVEMVPEPPTCLAVLGTGFEARGHVELLAGVWPSLKDVVAHSRSADNRAAFARHVTERTDLAVRTTDTPTEALGATTTVLLATKSSQPVLDGNDLLPGSVVLSIGSTRPDLRELDRRSLQRAACLVVDNPDQVLAESADIVDAVDAGALPTDRILPLAALAGGAAGLTPLDGDRDLWVFKSVGTALQDLALARAVTDLALKEGRGIDVGDVPRLKPFTR